MSFWGVRSRFLWKWTGAVFKHAGVTLSCVDKRFLEEITDIKILLTMLDAILDDLADRNKDWESIERVYRALEEGGEGILGLASDLWRYVISVLKKFQMFKYYEKILLFDLKQMINSMFYSCLVNTKPEIINFTESKINTAHNMIIYLYIDVDLIASPSFDLRELGMLREMIWYVQQMARVGNWITTWKRELKEKDFSSGVFAYAVSNGVIDVEDLTERSDGEIVKIIENSDVIEGLIEEWKRNYERVVEMASKFKSFDGLSFVKGFENLMKFHLASEGLK